MNKQQLQPVRCLIASGCPIATTTLYRCIHLQEQLRALGHEARVVEWFEEAAVDAAATQDCDAIFLYRLPLWPRIQQVIEAAKALGKPVIFDTDDLVFEPDFIDQQRAFAGLNPADQALHTEGVLGYLATLQACDVTVTATPLLAELARRRGKPGYVHRNALGSEMFEHAERLSRERQLRPQLNRVVIGYGSGTPTHDVDFREAADALIETLGRFREVELWIAGPLTLPQALDKFGDRVRRLPLTDWQSWFELAAAFDIAVAPLETNVFCRAKSEIKFIEAGALGVPVIGSRVDPFIDSITSGRDGLLAGNQAEWTEALATLIVDDAKRKTLGENARQTVCEHYSPHARTQQLAYLLPQLSAAIWRPSDARTSSPTAVIGETHQEIF